MAGSPIDEENKAVSYTHLDVYKRQAQSRLHLTGSGQRVGDPNRQAVHEVTDGFCAEVQAEEHRDAEEEELEDLRPPNSHEHDAFGVAGFGILIRLLNRIDEYDTADGMQLSTQAVSYTHLYRNRYIPAR